MSKVCPDCGAPLEGTDSQCWLCRAQAHGATHDINPYASPRPIAPLQTQNQFSLATLFLIMTLVAVAMGALMIAPGLGTFFIVLAVPALIRTVIVGRRRQELGEKPTIGSKILDFIASAAIIWVISIAATIAFGVVCTTAGLVSFTLFDFQDNPGFIIAVGAGLAAAAVVATWLLWITRPKSRPSAP
ncbi:MAG TPA: hypothetical protein VGI40_09405 [Pirellulaceae bacterium]|jgi:hypothetical protein